MNVVNVFLPTMKGTKLSFMRDVLADKKLHLKQNEVIRLDIPAYQELSVKNLYEDALKDPVLTKYLPTKEQLSNKLPEREFFFGVLCTLRKQYMTDIIQEASNKRFKVSDDEKEMRRRAAELAAARKRMEGSIVAFMRRFRLDDVKTRDGELRCVTRSSKRGPTKVDLERRIAEFFGEDVATAEALRGNLFEARATEYSKAATTGASPGT